MSNKTFHDRMYEIALNEGAYSLNGEFWKMLDRFAPGMYNYSQMYCQNQVTSEFIRKLPEFRKWAKTNNVRWFRSWEEREAWYNE